MKFEELVHVERKVGTLSPLSAPSAERLLDSFSHSHFELLAGADDPVKRTFYEAETHRGSWSVRGLKRQIASLFLEEQIRATGGLSR